MVVRRAPSRSAYSRADRSTGVPTLDRMVWPTDLRRALAAAAYLSLLATPASCARTREVRIPTVSGVGAGRQIEGHGKAAVTRIRVLAHVPP